MTDFSALLRAKHAYLISLGEYAIASGLIETADALDDVERKIVEAWHEIDGFRNSLDDHIVPDPDVRAALYAALTDVRDTLSTSTDVPREDADA